MTIKLITAPLIDATLKAYCLEEITPTVFVEVSQSSSPKVSILKERNTDDDSIDDDSDDEGDHHADLQSSASRSSAENEEFGQTMKLKVMIPPMIR